MYSPGSTLYDVVSSFRRYDQYVTELQSIMASHPESDVFVDANIITADSVTSESKSVVNSINTLSKTIANEAILSDSTNYNPLSEIKINPNPTTGSVNLSYSSESSNKIQIKVADNLNLSLIEKTWKIKEGENNITLDLTSYAGRLFFIKLTDKEFSYTFKVLKE